MLYPLLFAATLIWNGSKTIKSDDEWRRDLPRERYTVMRRKATELAFSGEEKEESGLYACAACGLAHFLSSSRMESIGWPSFNQPLSHRHVWIKEDTSLPFKRYELLCRSCDSHLGHVFRSKKDRSLRYTVNAVALEFVPSEPVRVQDAPNPHYLSPDAHSRVEPPPAPLDTR